MEQWWIETQVEGQTIDDPNWTTGSQRWGQQYRQPSYSPQTWRPGSHFSSETRISEVLNHSEEWNNSLFWILCNYLCNDYACGKRDGQRRWATQQLVKFTPSPPSSLSYLFWKIRKQGNKAPLLPWPSVSYIGYQGCQACLMQIGTLYPSELDQIGKISNGHFLGFWCRLPASEWERQEVIMWTTAIQHSFQLPQLAPTTKL